MLTQVRRDGGSDCLGSSWVRMQVVGQAPVRIERLTST